MILDGFLSDIWKNYAIYSLICLQERRRPPWEALIGLFLRILFHFSVACPWRKPETILLILHRPLLSLVRRECMLQVLSCRWRLNLIPPPPRGPESCSCKRGFRPHSVPWLSSLCLGCRLSRTCSPFSLQEPTMISYVQPLRGSISLFLPVLFFFWIGCGWRKPTWKHVNSWWVIGLSFPPWKKFFSVCSLLFLHRFVGQDYTLWIFPGRWRLNLVSPPPLEGQSLDLASGVFVLERNTRLDCAASCACK